MAAALAFGFCTALSAQPSDPKPKTAAHPLLWKIEGAGKKASWLFGTIHLPRPDVAAIAPAVAKAITESDAVYTEIPSDVPSMLSVMPHMMLPKDQTLPKVLGPELTSELEKEIKTINPALSLGPLSKLKPWAMVATLAQLEDQMKYPGTLAMDMVIFQRAAMAGKKVGGIETPTEQISAFEDFTDAEQVVLVEETIQQIRKTRAEGNSVSDLLAKLYLEGDLDRLVTELMKMDASKDHPELTEKFLERLLYRRNVIMAERMTKKLRDEPETAWFFAVGAAHLQGDRGLISDLTKAGFKLTRVQ